MAVLDLGLPTTKATLNGRVGSVTHQLRDALAAMRGLKRAMDGYGDADLLALGFTQDEINVLRPGITDLARLSAIADAEDVQAEPSDFFFWARYFIQLQQ